MDIPKNKLNKLKNELRGNSLKPVAEKLEITEQAVRDALNGKHKNADAISALIEYRDELKARTQELVSRI